MTEAETRKPETSQQIDDLIDHCRKWLGMSNAEPDGDPRCALNTFYASRLVRAVEQQRELIAELLEAAEKAAEVMALNIYPKPDVPPHHPFAILLKLQAVIAKAHGQKQSREPIDQNGERS